MYKRQQSWLRRTCQETCYSEAGSDKTVIVVCRVPEKKKKILNIRRRNKSPNIGDVCLCFLEPEPLSLTNSNIHVTVTVNFAVTVTVAVTATQILRIRRRKIP